MIYIVEVPHQMPPKVWSRETRGGILSVIKNDPNSPPNGTFYDYLVWNGHDLSAQLVFMSTDEARSALYNGTFDHVHQGIKAKHALEKCLEDYGE